jgi:hypothetical protein
MSATVTIPLLEFQALQNEVKLANDRVVEMAKLVDETKVAARSEDVTQIIALIHRAIPGMQHAISQLGAEISAWPPDAVHAWSDLIALTAGTTHGQIHEMALDIKSFARECEKSQNLRAARKAAMI